MQVAPHVNIDGSSVEAAGKVAVGALKIALVGGAVVAVWWFYGASTGTGVPGTLLRLAALPVKLTQAFLNSAVSELNSVLNAVEGFWASAQNIFGQYGYTSKRGVQAAWSSDTGWVPGREDELLPRTAAIFRKQGKYDASKGRISPWAFVMLQGQNFAIVPTANGTAGFFPNWYKQPWFSKEHPRSNGTRVAMMGYQEGVAESGARNAAYLLGRACALTPALAAFMSPRLASGHTQSLLQPQMRPYAADFELGFHDANLGLELT